MENRKFPEIPIRLEWIAFAVLAATTLLIRVINLSADPPINLSISQDVYTDPAQYTSYARNMILFGSFNPLHDFRLVFFLKSATTLLSILMFKLFGVGFMQAKLVGLFFSFPTLIMVYFIVRKIAGNAAALFYLILISIDFNQIFYGRMSFLENSMNFFAILSFTIMLFSRRAWPAALAGIFLGAGMFFSKLIGIIYLFPYAGYAIYEYFHDYRNERPQFIRRYAFFLAGFLALLLFWYFFSYRPMAQSVTGYIEEQAFSLYGIPEGLKSFSKFIYNYVSLGVINHLFERMSVPALLAWGMILIFLYRAGRKENWRQGLLGINPGILFMILLVIGSYGALMIWNYRPLRYQTMMIYPAYALAGIFLARLMSWGREETQPAEYKWFPLVFFLFSLIPIYQLGAPLFGFSEDMFINENQWVVLLVLGVLITAIVFLLKKYLFPEPLVISARFRNGIILTAVVAAIIPNVVMYISWVPRATYVTQANCRDLAMIVSPEAVISGPYAADLTQENRLFNLIHMFGVANIDTAFFRRYPITHIMVDNANDEYARQNYPEIMKKASQIATYFIGNRKVVLYRIAGLTGNVAADQYQLSDFESALSHYLSNKSDSGHYYMKRFQSRHPGNLTANYFVGSLSYDFNFYDDAEDYLKRAVAFSPTDFHLRYKLGDFYIKMFNSTGKPEYRDLAQKEFDAALKYNTVSRTLAATIQAKMNGEEGIEIE